MAIYSAVQGRVRLCAALCSVCVAWPLAAADATAQAARRPALHWSRGPAAESCIDPRTLAERVESITGPALVVPGSADVSIEAHIDRRAADQFEMRITVTQGRGPAAGERVLSFTTQDCRTLDAAIAFVIAMTIDPDAGAEGIPAELDWLRPEEIPAAEQLRADRGRPAPARAASPNAAAPAASPLSAAAHSPPRSVPASALPWAWLAALVMGSGPTHAPVAGLVSSLSRALSTHLSIALQLKAAASLAAVTVDGSRSVTTQTVGLSALACAHFVAEAPWRAQGCLGPLFNVMFAEGHGFADDSLALTASYGVASRFSLQYRVAPRWEMVAAALIDLDAAPPRIHYSQAGAVPVFRAKPFSIQGMLGVAHMF